MRALPVVPSAKQPRKTGSAGGAHVDHVEAPPAGLAAHAAPDRVRRPGLLVDDDVVGAVDAVVAGGLGEGHRRARGVPQLGEVEDLHAVRSGAVGDDEGVVAVHLDVAPEVLGGAFGQGQLAGVAGVGGVADVDEGRRVGASHQRPVPAGHRVGPAPDVVEDGARVGSQRVERHEGDQVDLRAVEGTGRAVGAGGLLAQYRVQGAGGLAQGRALDPGPVLALEDYGGAEPHVGVGGGDYGHVVTQGDEGAEEGAAVKPGAGMVFSLSSDMVASATWKTCAPPAPWPTPLAPTQALRPSKATAEP